MNTVVIEVCKVGSSIAETSFAFSLVNEAKF